MGRGGRRAPGAGCVVRYHHGVSTHTSGTVPALLGGRIYYGWVLVLALAITETTSFGVLYYSFTVFLAPMGQELGWSRGAMTGAFSLALLVNGVAAVPAGRWLDRHGPRALMTVGSCAATLLVLAWAATDDLVLFYLIWAAIGVTMAAVLYEPAFVVVATWFVRRRGRALTLLTFIAGFASVIYIPLAGWLVETRGWRGALVVLALLLGAGTIPIHALLLRRRPQDLGLNPDGAGEAAVAKPGGGRGVSPAGATPEASVSARAALRGRAFWWLAGAFCLNALGVVALNVHLVPYLIDGGYGAGFAAGAAGLVGIMALPGRLVFTPLGDLLPRSLVAALLFLLQAAALAALLLVPGRAGVFAFVLLFGAGFGAITPARAALVADFYGAAHYGSISGLLSLFVTGARALGPVLAGAGYDLGGSYAPVLWTLLVVSALAAVAVAVAERENERERGRRADG
jgi:MFS family permease